MSKKEKDFGFSITLPEPADFRDEFGKNKRKVKQIKEKREKHPQIRKKINIEPQKGFWWSR